MAIEHWTTAYLTGANASFQRSAREYAEEYAAMAVDAECERIKAAIEAFPHWLGPQGKRELLAALFGPNVGINRHCPARSNDEQ